MALLVISSEPYTLISDCVNLNTDYFGNDVGIVTNVLSMSACKNHCKATTGCTHYTWRMAGEQGSTNDCYLKSSDQGLSAQSGSLSGKAYCRQDRPGRRYVLEGFDASMKHKNQKILQVHGGWSAWSTAGSCSKTCGDGLQNWIRSCTAPAPSSNGNGCLGEATQQTNCNHQPCQGMHNCTQKEIIPRTSSK